MFERVGHFNDHFYQVELAIFEIQHKVPKIAGFFILQYANLRILELRYCFFIKSSDTDWHEEMEMDSDSVYLALAEKELYDCLRSDKKTILGIVMRQRLK